jgi:hypothetical protein
VPILVGKMFLAAGIGCFVGKVEIPLYLMRARPGKPQPEFGMIYPFTH